MRSLMLAAASAMAWAVPAAAGSGEHDAGPWQFELTPYVWGSAMKGDVSSGPLPRIATDMSFSDILHALDFGAMGAFEARRGRWGVLFDAVYMKISTAGTATRTTPGPLGATLTAGADLEMKQTMLAAGAGYRVVEGRSPVDMIGGLRYNRVEANAVVNASLFAMAGTVARGAGERWVDPYVGARVQHTISNRWTLVAYGDVGGFGIGSDLAWQALFGANYDFSKTVSGKLGYRVVAADYDKGGFLYDMTNSGAYVGVGFRF
jgi:hypothetical protein